MTHFDEEMSKLKDSLLAMASHAESAVARHNRAFGLTAFAIAEKT